MVVPLSSFVPTRLRRFRIWICFDCLNNSNSVDLTSSSISAEIRELVNAEAFELCLQGDYFVHQVGRIVKLGLRFPITCNGGGIITPEQKIRDEQLQAPRGMAMTDDNSPDDPSSNFTNVQTSITISRGTSPKSSESGTLDSPPSSRSRSQSPDHFWASKTQSNWISIPSALNGNHDSSYDAHRAEFTVPNSWQSTFQTPSSCGGTSILVQDDAASVNGDDDRSDISSNVGSVARLSYARKRKLLRHMNKATHSSAISLQGLRFVRERWKKKLAEFREYEVGMLKSLLPLKAGVGAALAGCLAFLPFGLPLLSYYGVVAALGVDWSIESNVGLTLQKGCNLILGSGLAGVCALAVHLMEPYTGSFRVYFLIICVFLGGCLPRCIALPKVVRTRWSQTTYFYVFIFHVLILNRMVKIEYTAQFLLNCVCYSFGFITVLFLILCIKPDFAGDALLVLLVNDFHTTGVVLERIVNDYKGGVVLTKSQGSGAVVEDNIRHDLKYIMKSTDQVEHLMNAAKWEPSHGKFFKGYPWDLYPTLKAILVQVMYDLMALDSALRAEIQPPLEIRLLFAEEMKIVARECSMLFHKVGDALLDHKKIDYHSNAQSAQIPTLHLSTKLVEHSATLIAQDDPLSHSCSLTRDSSLQPTHEGCDKLPDPMAPVPTPPSSPNNAERDKVIQQDPETAQKRNSEDDWRARLFTRRHSIHENWEETQQQISSLSFIKFSYILIELMGRVNCLVTMVDQISEKAHFSDVSEPLWP